jgi:iron(III) transport system permease protein
MSQSVLSRQTRVGEIRLRKPSGNLGTRIFYVVVIGLILYLVLVPVLMLIYGSFRKEQSGLPTIWTLANYVEAYGDSRSFTAITNSFIYAGGATIISVALATGMAWAIERTNAPLRRWIFPLMLVPMAIPGVMFSISWILLLSPRIGFINVMLRHGLDLIGIHLTQGPFNIYSMHGMIFLEGLRGVPTIFLIVSASFKMMDPSLEEAAVTSGSSTLETARKVTFPILFPAILGAAIYSFISAIESFEIPGIIGLPADVYVFSTRIYWAANVKSPPDIGLANSFGVTFLTLSLLLLWLYRRTTRRADAFATITGKGYRSKVVDLGKWRWLVGAIFAVFFTLVIVLPLFVLAWTSMLTYAQVPSLDSIKNMSLDNYTGLRAVEDLGAALKNTLFLVFFAATFTMLLAFGGSWISLRGKIKGGKWLDTLMFLPHTLPGIVIGLAFLVLYLGPLHFIPIYGTIIILLLAYITKFMAFGSRTSNASLLQVHKDLEEAAYVSGASTTRTLRTIVGPLIAPAFVNGWIWVAIHSMREVSVALMLFSTSNGVLGTKLWFMWKSGNAGGASALGVVLIVGLVIMTGVGQLLVRRLTPK